jgi:uncharacterized protein YkwD
MISSNTLFRRLGTALFLAAAALLLGACDTLAAGASPAEQAVLDELNYVRTRPSDYAATVLPTYRNAANAAAADAAVAELKATGALPVLSLAAGLCRAARDHVADQGPRGTTGHTGSDGSSPFERMDRYGAWGGTAGENIAYGYETARDIVAALVIDQGVAGAGHRKNILNLAFTKAGIALGDHSVYGSMCVQDFAASYQ